MGVLDQKVAIVTGSARGIGKATAEILSRNGARVAACDLDVDLAERDSSWPRERARRPRRRRPDQGAVRCRAGEDGDRRVGAGST